MLGTGCFKKNGAVFILQISWQPSIGISNHFFLLKTEIHMQILNTKPFLYDLMGPRYLRNKMGLVTKAIVLSLRFFYFRLSGIFKDVKMNIYWNVVIQLG